MEGELIQTMLGMLLISFLSIHYVLRLLPLLWLLLHYYVNIDLNEN